MFMPCCNCFGFGFAGGFYNPCGFGMPYMFTPFLPDLALQTTLCSTQHYNYNFQSSYNFQTPNISSFLPEINYSQVTYNSSGITPDNSYATDIFSSICNNVAKSCLNQVSYTSSYPTTYSSTTSTTSTTSKETAKTTTSKTATSQTTTSKTTSQKTATKKEISYDAKKLEEKWKNSKYASRAKRLPSEFFQKVVDISKKINCNPDDLMTVMNAESGLSASAKNTSSSATGLIQFMDSTAKSLGTSCAALAKMTETEQLDYVEKYFVNWKKTDGLGNSYLDLATLYALVFAPANANQEVLYAKNSAGYNGNKSLDTDGKNGITKSEAEARVIQFMA